MKIVVQSKDGNTLRHVYDRFTAHHLARYRDVGNFCLPLESGNFYRRIRCTDGFTT